MFQKKKLDLSEQNISTLISEGCTIEGQVKAPAVARIDGTVQGNVTIEQGLILGEKGLITGDIHTKDFVIYGTVIGNVKAQSIEIKSTGNVTGDLQTQQLQVDPGAVYNGALSMESSRKKQELLQSAS
ncbi:hypothetical protein GS399_08920 [Pedobacter sp. HMF7647]|uniref:Polymer-forming cytoskeletal protein n=1 Tax=Hufsiella arboris TaxID=2695275 RepID=A0A7K1Y9J3_9SPHI|nr:polymer-forming cytoskeletal protein [Hufsiella arboris]MXV51090.1 hypothetical protein [Hufsiella arboris]